jgi:hypothetical protein
MGKHVGSEAKAAPAKEIATIPATTERLVVQRRFMPRGTSPILCTQEPDPFIERLQIRSATKPRVVAGAADRSA